MFIMGEKLKKRRTWKRMQIKSSGMCDVCCAALCFAVVCVSIWFTCWLTGLKANPADRSVFSPHMCNCWCTQWAEFHIRRPTGNLSWIMRLQNEQDLMSMFPDFALSDISNLFMPFSADEDPEPSPVHDAGKMLIVFNLLIMFCVLDQKVDRYDVCEKSWKVLESFKMIFNA